MEPIWEILARPAWYWLITIIPTILTFIGAFQNELPSNQRSGFLMQIYNLVPHWVWLIAAAVAFVITILISTNNYVKKKLSENASASVFDSRTQSKGQQGGVTTGKFEGNYHQGDNIYPPPVNEENLPNIEIKEGHTRRGVLDFLMFNRSGAVVQKHPLQTTFIEVVFSNNPLKRTSKSTSRNVRAEITYYEINGSKIGSTHGGWMDIKSREITKTVDLLYNGDSEVLLLGVRFLDEPYLYMYGLETNTDYFSVRDHDFKYRLCKGESKDFQITIHLIGENLDKEYNLILHYAGKDGDSILELK